MDDVIGYEGNTDGSNPNYTRSIGYSVEPTTLVGGLLSYKIIDAITVQAGIANGLSGPAGTARPATRLWPTRRTRLLGSDGLYRSR